MRVEGVVQGQGGGRLTAVGLDCSVDSWGRGSHKRSTAVEHEYVGLRLRKELKAAALRGHPTSHT